MAHTGTYELIVVGAGPAGISMAVEARHAGILAERILVLEKAEEHSWTIRSGHETNIPGLFLVGDLSSGRRGGSIIAAFNTSHAAMRRICEKYLTCRVSPSGHDTGTVGS